MSERRLQFSGFEHLKRWLLTTKWGAEVMRDVLHSKDGERFYAEFVDRELSLLSPETVRRMPAYVVVEVAHDGWVAVYGEKNVRARIVQRPSAPESDRVRVAKLVDEWIWLNLPAAFRDIYYPTAVCMTGLCRPLSLRQLVQDELDRQFDMGALKALEGVSK